MKSWHGMLVMAVLAAGFVPPPAPAAAPVVQSQPVLQRPPLQTQSQSPSQPAQAQQPQFRSGAATGSTGGYTAAQPQGLGAPAGPSQDTMVEMYERLDALQRDVQELRGMVEEESHRGSSLEQRQRELYLDIDRRLRGLEQNATTPAGGDMESPPSSAPAASAPSVPAPGATAPYVAPVTTAGSSSEREEYDRGYDLVKAGRYDEGIAALRDFLVRHPGSEYSANAQYWVGEANYVSRRFDVAVQEFEKVVDAYPDSGKAPDAMLKLGFSLYELQQWGRAGEVLRRVVERYPGSTARQLADGRLQRMRMEGH